MNDLASAFGMKSREGTRVALRRVSVAAHIAGVLAETRLTQHYLNATDKTLEFAYTFPLPTDAVLLAFEVKVGERELAGHVLPRQEAEEGYEQAIEQGDAAFRLQQVRDGIYSVALGNVAPGETVELSLRYAQVVSVFQGRLRYRLPTAIAPRYGEPRGMEPWQRPAVSLLAEYPLEVEVTVCGAWAKGAFECPTHPVACAVIDQGIRLVARGAFLDRDFIVDLRPETVSSTVLAARSGGALRIGAFVLPPPVAIDDQVGRNYVLVIDCSGSMQGDSLAQAKAGVLLALQQLTPRDRFALIAFGSHLMPFDPDLQPASRKNLALAASWVEGLGDMGGTELPRALLAALDYAKQTGELLPPLDILVLTDGECWEHVAAAAAALAWSVRLFTIGVGSAAAEDTVRQLAERSKGAWEMVTPNEDMAERIAAHFARMRQPRLERVNLELDGEPAWIALPQRACFAGDSLALFAEWPAEVALPATISVRLHFADGSSSVVAMPLAEAAGLDDSLGRIAAAARLPALLGSHERQDWAVRHQLICQETDYLLTVARPEGAHADGLPVLHIVSQMLAAGWGASSSVCRADVGAYDVPAVIRSGRRSDVAFQTRPSPSDDPLPAMPVIFVRRLNKACRRFFWPRLPSLSVLAKLGMPAGLLHELEKLAADRRDEAAIIVALVLGLKRLGIDLPPRLDKLVASAQATTPLPRQLVEAVQQLLEGTDEMAWTARWEPSTASRAPGTYDIPAFLRSQAD